MTDTVFFIFTVLAGLVFGSVLWLVDPNIMAVILGASFTYVLIVIRLLKQN